MASAGFNDAALAKLTAKIDSKLAQPTTKSQSGQRQQPSPGGKNNTSMNGARSFDKKRKQSSDRAPRPSDTASNKRPRQEISAGPKAPSKNAGQYDGPASAKRPQRTTQASSDKIPTAVNTDKNVLLEEILALGGNEDDLDLVGDADSDDEAALASSANPDKDLQAELAQFAAALGFDKVAPVPDEDEDQDNEHNREASDGSDGVEEDPEDDNEDDDSELDDDEEIGGAPVAKTAAANKPAPQNQTMKAAKGKTVSTKLVN